MTFEVAVLPIYFKTLCQQFFIVELVICEERFFKAPGLVKLLTYHRYYFAGFYFERGSHHFPAIIRRTHKWVSCVVGASCFSFGVNYDFIRKIVASRIIIKYAVIVRRKHSCQNMSTIHTFHKSWLVLLEFKMNVKLRVTTLNVKRMLNPAITEPANTLTCLFDCVTLTSVCVAVDFVGIGKFCLIDLKKAEWIHFRIDAFLNGVKTNQNLVLAESVFEDAEFKGRYGIETDVNVKEACILLQTLSQFPNQCLARRY